MKAVILAGGEGKRLLPHTIRLPKPMVPIGTRPILEIVVDRLRRAGIGELILATGYLHDVIHDHFGDGERLGVRIEYSKEDTPLGTAGPLDLLRDRLDSTFLVMNGDILTDLDFHRLVRHHHNRRNTATVVMVCKTEAVDFGVIRLDADDRLIGWAEKPAAKYLVSAGIHLLEPSVLAHVPRRACFTIPELMLTLRDHGLAVRGFLHEGYWQDIGRPHDYEQACRDLANGALA